MCPNLMGDSYRDYLKGRGRARRRVGETIAAQAAVEARAKAIREKNRQTKAQTYQYKMRLDAINP